MTHIIHIHAEKIVTLEDVYIIIETFLWESHTLYARNLDALYDVLSESPLEKVVIHEKKKLKIALDKDYEDSDNMTPYYQLLDVFVDLDGVDIELID